MAQWPHHDGDLSRLLGLHTPVLSDAMDSLKLPNTVMDSSIRQLAGKTLVGRARTLTRVQAPVNSDQNDLAAPLSLAAQTLIDSCAVGDVIIVSFQGKPEGAVWGDNMCERARMLGVNGIITDGAVRDVEAMQEIDFPTFAASVTPRQSVGRVVTTGVDQPIICGGVLVRPGDFIVGDRTGIVVIPRDNFDKVVEEARRIENIEIKIKKFLSENNSIYDSVIHFKQR